MPNTSPIQRFTPEGLFDSSAYGFAQVVRVVGEGSTVFISGQFAGNKDGNIAETTMQGQMKASFQNLRLAIDGAGAKPEHVVRIRVLIVDHTVDYLEPLAAEAKALFGDELPASTLIPVPRLALDEMLFEIEATLFVPNS